MISIPVGDKKSPFTSTVDIDTSNILFICGGAFDGIQKKIEPEKTIGFSKDSFPLDIYLSISHKG